MKETLEASMSYTLEKDEGGCAAITRRDGARTQSQTTWAVAPQRSAKRDLQSPG